MVTKIDKDIEVRMSNTLVEARYEYSENQLDILFYLLSLLHKNGDSMPITSYEIHLGELENIRGAVMKSYRIHEILLDMNTKPINIRTPDMEDTEDFHTIFLFSQFKYRKGKRLLKIQLTEAVIPYLFDLKREFTSMELYSVLRMTSKYAKRIYQICCQWKNAIGDKMFYIDDLKKMLGCENEYKQITEFRKYVLDVAKKQINESTDIYIDFQLDKEHSRSFNVVYFTIQKQKVRQIPIDYRYNEKQGRAKMQLEKIGIVDEKLQTQILTLHLDGFNKWLYDYQTGKFKVLTSPSGHLLKTLGLVVSKASSAIKS
jgi:plasmid replication initiation protein